jgi:hypothetical protein
MLFAPLSPVKTKRIQRTLLSDRNRCFCSDISKASHSSYLFTYTYNTVT